MKIHHPTEFIEDTSTALQMLKDGNERYLKGEFVHKSNYSADRAVLSSGQRPFAVILTCSDSRVAPEIFFDQKLGSIFVIRNAGNIVDMTVLGSLEYAIEYLKSRLVVVCGHSKCGAVTAACSGEELPLNIKHIVEYIIPAVKMGGDIDEVVHNNVKIMVDHIKEDEMAGARETHVTNDKCMKGFVGELGGKRPLGRPRRK
jgi:carbonic anhydrase